MQCFKKIKSRNMKNKMLCFPYHSDRPASNHIQLYRAKLKTLKFNPVADGEPVDGTQSRANTGHMSFCQSGSKQLHFMPDGIKRLLFGLFFQRRHTAVQEHVFMMFTTRYSFPYVLFTVTTH